MQRKILLDAEKTAAGAAGQKLGNGCPLAAESQLRGQEALVLLLGPERFLLSNKKSRLSQ